MSDARWIEVEADFVRAAEHFERSVALYEAGGFEGPGLDGYRARMAFMHAMMAAHSSLESGLVRILEMLGEQKPIGATWHADLIQRAARTLPDLRPAILPPNAARAADETRRFRPIAVRAYDNFDHLDAAKPVGAARVLAEALPLALKCFRDAMD